MEMMRFPLYFWALCAVLLYNASSICHGHVSLPGKNVAIFVFGDSIFDAGNNNYINTITQANYFPYGESFFKNPTGRFSDGRIIPDFIAEYVKLPFIPPYLQPGNSDYSIGVNFASAGAGALDETNQGMVIDLGTQLSYFKNVSRHLRKKLGDAEAKALLSRAVFLFSVGGNDYVFPFSINSSVLRSYSREEFVGQVIGNITEVIQDIYKIGGRKFGFLNLLPLACVPFLRVIPGQNGACLDQISPFVELHNKEISNLLQKEYSELNGFKYSLLDVNTFLKERMDHPSKYGFKESKIACCGSGPYRGILSCGGKRGVTEYELCDNVSEYVFFDSGHLTDKAHQQFAKLVWSEKLSFKGGYNLKSLFELK
ncbi:hypothetical protein UlMin_012090 [Ulmus minor]